MASEVISFPVDQGKRRYDEFVTALGVINRLRQECSGTSFGTGLPSPKAPAPPAPKGLDNATLSQRVRTMLLDGRPSADIIAEIEAWEQSPACALSAGDQPQEVEGGFIRDPTHNIRAEAVADEGRRTAALHSALETIRKFHGLPNDPPEPFDY